MSDSSDDIVDDDCDPDYNPYDDGKNELNLENVTYCSVNNFCVI